MDEQCEEQDNEPVAPSVWHLTRQQVALASGTMLAATGVDLLAHLGATGLVVGGILAFAAARHGQGIYSQVQGLLSPAPAPASPHSHAGKRSKRSVLDRALGRFPDTLEAEEEEPLPLEAEQEDPHVPEGNLLHQSQQAPQAGGSLPPRLSIDEIVRHIEPNSYRMCLGRSLTRPGAPAVLVSFKGRHLKLIGASQYGKSSMAAALLEIITRTHDPDHVLVALLDVEDQTSKLFSALPHLAEVITSDRPMLLYARTHDEVLSCLRAIAQVIHLRYALSKTELLYEPILLVYLEEFIALKDTFKLRIDAVGRDEKDQARRDYASLVYCIKEIARRGLKARVQLLLCAQVDYRDDDLQEALINVTSGMSFCVRVSAAQAAGFYHTELLTRNAKDDKPGQMVVEMPDCKDLVLAPLYDLERRLLALEAWERAQARSQHQAGQGVLCLRPAQGHRDLPTPRAFSSERRAWETPTSPSMGTVWERPSERLNALNAPLEPSETSESRLKRQTMPSGASEASEADDGPKRPDQLQTIDEVLKYFKADHDAIIASYLRVARTKGHDKVLRADIMKDLGWDNYRHRTVKLVCDHYHLAMPKGQ
jgi:hypothetical protein